MISVRPWFKFHAFVYHMYSIIFRIIWLYFGLTNLSFTLSLIFFLYHKLLDHFFVSRTRNLIFAAETYVSACCALTCKQYSKDTIYPSNSFNCDLALLGGDYNSFNIEFAIDRLNAIAWSNKLQIKLQNYIILSFSLASLHKVGLSAYAMDSVAIL